MLYDHLLAIAQSPNRDRLSRFEGTLTDYGRSVSNNEYQVYRFVDPQLRILDEVYKILGFRALELEHALLSKKVSNKVSRTGSLLSADIPIHCQLCFTQVQTSKQLQDLMKVLEASNSVGR